MTVHAQHVLELVLFIAAGLLFGLAALVAVLAPVALRLVAGGLALVALAEIIMVASAI